MPHSVLKNLSLDRLPSPPGRGPHTRWWPMILTGTALVSAVTALAAVAQAPARNVTVPVVTAPADAPVLAEPPQPPAPVAAASPVIAAAAQPGTELLKDDISSTSKPAPAAMAAPQKTYMWMEVTAYCSCPLCCGKGANGITASGKTVRYNRGKFVAADTRLLPFGTKLVIPGYNNDRPVEVIDRGRLIKGRKIDLFFPNHQAAQDFGVQRIKVEVVK